MHALRGQAPNRPSTVSDQLAGACRKTRPALRRVLDVRRPHRKRQLRAGQLPAEIRGVV